LNFETIDAQVHRFETLRLRNTNSFSSTFNIGSGEDRYEETFQNNHQALFQSQISKSVQERIDTKFRSKPN
jgi:hypothetical protein